MLDINTSTSILKNKVGQWFATKKITSWDVLDSLNPVGKDALEKKDHIVLFGDFMAAYLYLSEQEITAKKIYVLCRKAKVILQDLDKESIHEILVINRYDLFPVDKKERALPNFKKDQFDFVYSGRISRPKNILLLVHIVKILQQQNPKIGLKLIGEYDHIGNAGTDNVYAPFTLKKSLHDLIAGISWTKKPEIIHGHTTESWKNEINENDVLINLSRFWMEDFSVSVAQAQELGVPVVIADIGGMSDVSGGNVIKISGHLFGNEEFPENDEILEGLAQSISAAILNFKRRDEIEVPQSSFPFIPKFAQIQGDSVLDFMSEVEGKRFFKQYEKIWRGDTLKRKKRKILFLRTKEQDTWISLITICKQIELFWNSFQDDENVVTYFQADYPISKERLSFLMEDYDLIVAPALTSSVIRALQLIRLVLKKNSPIIAYPHELPSIYFASLKIREAESFFRKSDLFIVHCEADLELTKKTFKEVNVFKVPAAFIGHQDIDKVERKTYPIKELCYVGRISEQKNLHTLFWAIALIKEELIERGITLSLYGHYDHFGSPNTGYCFTGYYDFLGEAIERLDIGSIVKFKGFEYIKDWGEFAHQKCLAGIFPGIHADENFGIAPYDFLKNGIPTIMTNWGGYRDLAKAFPQSAHTIPVHLGEYGPFVDPTMIAKTILAVLNDRPLIKADLKKVKFEWLRTMHVENLKALLANTKLNSEKLMRTKDSIKAMEQCQFSTNAILKGRVWLLNGVVFKGYQDLLLHKASRAYGAKKYTQKYQPKKNHLYPFWLKKSKAGFLVNDPMKGVLKFKNEKELFANGLSFLKRG